ncbi:hypothetical protein Tco_0009310 [Tanacetum coccineum]
MKWVAQCHHLAVVRYNNTEIWSLLIISRTDLDPYGRSGAMEVRVAVKVERGGSGCCRSWWWGKGDDGDVAVKMVIVAAVGGFRGGDDCSDEGDEDGNGSVVGW